MDGRDTRRGGDPYYRDFARLYDEISLGVPGDIEFYVGLAVRTGGTVVELGVGTGRIAVPTALAGVRMIGIDCEPAMLEIAAAKAADAGVQDRLRLIEGDMRTFELDEPVGLVTIPFRTFLHNLTEEDQLATLAVCHRALRSGGRLAMNVFNPDLVRLERWRERSPRHGEPHGRRGVDQGQFAHESGSARVKTTLRVRASEGGWTRTSFELRYVQQREMASLLHRSGFEVDSLMGGFAGEPFDDSSPEMVWIARASGDAVRGHG